jgi:hypothetical protein
MDVNTIIIVACFSALIISISIVVIVFLILGRRLEHDYVDKLGDKQQLLLDAMDKDTIFERMVRGGMVLQYITILGAFSAVFFLAILGHISAEIAATIIGMIITAVIGAEAGLRASGETSKESYKQKRNGRDLQIEQ